MAVAHEELTSVKGAFVPEQWFVSGKAEENSVPY